MLKPADGRYRVVIEKIVPQVDAGRHPVRRVVGDTLDVTATIYADGHDQLAARLLYRHERDRKWRTAAMKPRGNDSWNGCFHVDAIGAWRFSILGWVDHFESWAADLRKRMAAPLDLAPGEIPLALRTGAVLLQQGASRARGAAARKLSQAAQALESLAVPEKEPVTYPLGDEIHRIMAEHPDLSHATRYDMEIPLWADRERARFSAWYEMFPRSASAVPGQHGTFWRRGAAIA